MQVRFKLPSGGSGIPANMKSNHIQGDLLLWCASYGYLYQDLSLNRYPRKGLVCNFKTEDMFNTFRLTWGGADYERY